MVHTNSSSNCLNQSTAEQGFGATVFSGRLDDVARQRGDGAPQVRPQGCFSRLPLRQRKQQPAFVQVNGEDAIVLSQPGGDFLFRKKIAVSEGSNTITVEATDASNNTASNSYSVVVGGVQKTLEYDLNGNLRYEKDPGGTVLREIQWDAINRLMKIIDGTQETEFVYDGFDRRVRIIEEENGVEQSNHTYLWDGTYIAQRRSADGSTIERSYFSQGFEEGSDDYYTTKDHLGSIREVVASDGTTIEAAYDYSPWGEVTKIAGTGVESDFLYTGHFYHDTSELHLTLYRAYNPELGMWLSRDPIAENGGLNLYAYVGNDPVNWWDPLGLDVYVVNRQLGGNEARSRFNPLSHTFMARTDECGKVTNTYSWGNDYDENGDGIWFENASNDMEAAQQAVDEGKAKWLAPASYHDSLAEAFDQIRDSEDSKHGWNLFNSCKHEACDLWDMARDLEEDGSCD